MGMPELRPWSLIPGERCRELAYTDAGPQCPSGGVVPQLVIDHTSYPTPPEYPFVFRTDRDASSRLSSCFLLSPEWCKRAP